jgi:phenylalanyl-tRNA synthetase beta chain
LRTDAATHFEKGVDINNIIPALVRAANMIIELAGGNIASEVIDVYPQPVAPVIVNVRYDYIQKLSGKQYDSEAIKTILQALGFGIEQESDTTLTLSVPSNKTDVTHPADIVEEVVRIDGLDNIVIPERLNISLSGVKPSDRPLREELAQLLCGLGFQEIVTNSIVNSKYYPGRTDLVKMLNSLSSELDVMRPGMLESGLEVIQYNCNRKSNDLMLFEFGNVYTKSGERYLEETQLALWVTGNTRAGHWDQAADPADLYYLKGILENLFRRAGVHTSESYEEGRAVWKYKNQVLATLVLADAQQLKVFDIKQDVYFAAINWQLLYAGTKTVKVRYREVPKFPAVQRDLAIVLDKGITYQHVEQATAQLKIPALRKVGLFDVFESEKLGPGRKSYALSYTFQLQDRTLTDAETDQLMQQLIEVYKTKLDAQIRE